MADGGGDQDQRLSRAHRLSADLPAILRTYKVVCCVHHIACDIRYARYDAPREHCTERGWICPSTMYSPRIQLGGLSFSTGMGPEWGDDRRKWDGTSRDAQELPDTEVVPHLHNNSIVSRVVRVLCTSEHASMEKKVYIVPIKLRPTRFDLAGRRRRSNLI